MKDSNVVRQGSAANPEKYNKSKGSKGMEEPYNGSERRRVVDTQIGYMTAKIESIESKFQNHIDAEEYHFERMGSEIKALREFVEEDLKNIKEQLTLYRHFILFLKVLGALLLFFVTWKWEAVKQALDNLLHW